MQNEPCQQPFWKLEVFQNKKGEKDQKMINHVFNENIKIK